MTRGEGASFSPADTNGVILEQAAPRFFATLKNDNGAGAAKDLAGCAVGVWIGEQILHTS